MPNPVLTPKGKIRCYVSVRAKPAFAEVYDKGNVSAVADDLNKMFFKDAALPSGGRLEISGLPSRALLDSKIEPTVPGSTDRRVVQQLVDRATWRRLQAEAETLRGQGEISGVATEFPVYSTRHCCPGRSGGPFGTRAMAERLLGIDKLREAQPRANGKGVNIALFDHGFDSSKLLKGTFGGGWVGGTRPPGATTQNGHGIAMARLIQAVAPKAMIFDYPVLPPRITDIPTFLGEIHAAYQYLIADMAARGGPWIAVNAWSTFSRPEDPAMDDYSDHPNHLFNLKISQVVDAGADVVFAAGNCGQFCPSQRCGNRDRGPGSSIFGANSHPRVVTVGAVRSDGIWLGYSSQGEGQPHLERQKPDICAASDFRAGRNARSASTGTSTACALTAGVIAAVRSAPGASKLPPDQFRQLVISTARRAEAATWDPRFGHGILNAAALHDAVRAATGPDA